ncbi:hypothetical protein LA374_13525 [Aeromonas schubertii]|uniref:Uncharacterized protein n=1 Tax=Aeromonas schubertii TaxID=652 RepID=A0ABS7VCV4_9GAMM|nr:hypothetical protein [Aeromonas schubertii]MBZ6067217.1 hypothetical protein [Aeromonas schubertii]MBZ6071223.1 hypothetical protein [Aeromonas schubertii]
MPRRRRASLVSSKIKSGWNQRRRLKLSAEKRQRHRRQRSDFLLPAPLAA